MTIKYAFPIIKEFLIRDRRFARRISAESAAFVRYKSTSEIFRSANKGRRIARGQNISVRAIARDHRGHVRKGSRARESRPLCSRFVSTIHSAEERDGGGDDGGGGRRALVRGRNGGTAPCGIGARMHYMLEVTAKEEGDGG